MKKIAVMGIAVMMMALMLTGCDGGSDYLLDENYADYVTLCDYKGVEAAKVTFAITDEQVRDEIEMNRYENAVYDEITDRAAREGDYATIDCSATLDGKASEDYSLDEEELLVGGGYFFPEVDEALIGMKTGEEKTLEVTLTEDYAEDADVGKTLSLDLTLKKISVENVPEYDEEYVKKYTDFDTIEDYEASVRADLEKSTEEEYKYTTVEEIMSYILDNSEFNGYPEELYDSSKENYDSANNYNAAMYGMTVDEYLESFGIDEEAQEAEIEENVNYELVIGAIAQAEGIKCTKKEISDFIKEIYADYGYSSEEEFSEAYTDEEVGYAVVSQKVMDFLYENADLYEISEEEYMENSGDWDDAIELDGDDVIELDGDDVIELDGSDEDEDE